MVSFVSHSLFDFKVKNHSEIRAATNINFSEINDQIPQKVILKFTSVLA